jgi:hypothetical protein
MKMSKYSIKVEQVGYTVVEVEAEDEFQAEDIAMEMWGNGELDHLFAFDVQLIVDN